MCKHLIWINRVTSRALQVERQARTEEARVEGIQQVNPSCIACELMRQI